jgi:hypothetical protein
MLDPLILKLVSIGFGLLFLLAAVHKLTALERFRATLAAYELLPGMLIAPLSVFVPILEAVLGTAWLFGYAPVSVALASAVLLAAYTSSITINLFRGRVHIDCGCGMASTAGGDQQLSWGLVVRNCILIVAALAATLPASERTIGLVDYVTLIAGLLAIVLLYGAANQLMNNGAAIGTWRNRHD